MSFLTVWVIFLTSVLADSARIPMNYIEHAPSQRSQNEQETQSMFLLLLSLHCSLKVNQK